MTTLETLTITDEQKALVSFNLCNILITINNTIVFNHNIYYISINRYDTDA